jgi:AcrR family transcriptional regulator
MRRAIPALLETATVAAAAERAELSESTIYRYLRDEDFQAALRREQDAIIANTTASLVGSTGEVLEELYRIALHGDRDSVKVQAIKTWLKHTYDALEIRDIIERLEALENETSD